MRINIHARNLRAHRARHRRDRSAAWLAYSGSVTDPLDRQIDPPSRAVRFGRALPNLFLVGATLVIGGIVIAWAGLFLAEKVFGP